MIKYYYLRNYTQRVLQIINNHIVFTTFVSWA